MKTNPDLIFKKVLCLAPHPDDVELSFSGTIKKTNNLIGNKEHDWGSDNYIIREVR